MIIDLIGRIIRVDDVEVVYHSGHCHYIGQLCFTLANERYVVIILLMSIRVFYKLNAY